MIRSMSGHGRGEAASGPLRVVAEVRSVNHRYCRVALRLPAALSSLEEEVRRRVQALVQRGKVDVQVSVEVPPEAAARLDREAAATWVRELRAIAGAVGIEPQIRLADLLALPGVMVVAGNGDVDAAADAEAVRGALEQALEAFDRMRRSEGAALARDVRARVAALRAGVERISEQASELPTRVREQLQERLADLLGEAGRVDQERLLQEAAYYAERADVTEELVRLRSHLDKIDQLLGSGEAVGRTLEFVAQEIHRELTTIGSKAKDLQIADRVLELKAELERVREQVQNIE